MIEFDEFITDETVKATRKGLLDPKLTDEMWAHKYELALQHFS